MLMDDPWSIDQEMTVAKWDLDPIKGCSRKTRSRDQVFDPCRLVDDPIDQSRFPEPDWPMIAKNSPCAIVKLISWST